MLSKKRMYSYLSVLALLVVSIVLMLATKGIAFHSQAGPKAPLILTYYNYMHPSVYFGGGMYPAPLAVILASLSAVLSGITLLRGNKGKATFFTTAAACLMVLFVAFLLQITLINLVIALLLFCASVVAYFAAYRL